VVLTAFDEREVLSSWREQAAIQIVATALVLLVLAGLTVMLLRQLRQQQVLVRSVARGEARYRSLIDTANEGVWKVDTAMRTTLVNAKMADMLGYSSEELMGRSPEEFVTDEDVPVLQAANRERLAHGRLQYEMRWKRRDGSLLPSIVSVNSVYDADSNYIGALAMVTDITERVLAEADVQHHLKHLEALHAMDKAILEAQSRDAIAAVGLRHVKDLVPYWGATVMAFDFAHNEGVVLNMMRAPGSAYDPGTRLTLDDFGREDIALMQSGTERVVADIEALPSRSPVLDALYAKGMRSYVRIPLLAEGELVGTLNLGNNLKGAYSPEQVSMARSIADQLAIALRQAALR
jgi:PAS domain S-box-containing protein